MWIASLLGYFVGALFITFFIYKCLLYALRRTQHAPIGAFLIGIVIGYFIAPETTELAMYVIALAIWYFRERRRLSDPGHPF